jgi:hypothetical protein
MKEWKWEIHFIENVDMKRRIGILNDRNRKLSENLISLSGFILGKR